MYKKQHGRGGRRWGMGAARGRATGAEGVFRRRRIGKRAYPLFFYALQRYIKSWKTSAVSTTVCMVEIQLCKLRGTSDTFV